MLFGKQEPYDTDVRVPFYVRGPGVPANEVRSSVNNLLNVIPAPSWLTLFFPLSASFDHPQTRFHPTNHIDIAATIVDLANAHSSAPANLEGKSFKSLMTSNPPSVAAWRPWSFSEFYIANNTWLALRLINETTGMPAFKLIWWCTNQSEVFLLHDDPFETVNVAGDHPTAEGQAVVEEWLPTLLALRHCKGAECQAPTPVKPVPGNPLPCFTDDVRLDVPETWYDP